MDQNPFTVPVSNPTPQFGNSTPANKEDSMLGVVCHLLSFVGFVMPLGNILGPLVLWLIKRGSSPYLDAVGKETLNFNISWSIYLIVAALTMLVLIGFVLFPLVALAWLVLAIIGAVTASNGKFHRYPLTIRFIQ